MNEATTDRWRVRVWSSDGVARVGPPAPHGEWVLEPGAPDLDEPGQLTAAASELVGVPLEFLRIPAAQTVEFALMRELPSDTDLPLVLDKMEPLAVARPYWHRPGWIMDTLARVQELLAGMGIRLTGAVELARHTTVTGLLRASTTDGEVWVKAMPEKFSVEGPLSRYLHGQGFNVPDVVATAPGLVVMRPFPAVAADAGRGHFLVDMARLQVSLLHNLPDVRELGVPQLSVEHMADEIGPGSSAERHSGRLLSALASTLAVVRDVSDEIAGADIPSALVHGDLHVENVRYTPEGWFLFDWTDACLAHPFVDIAVAHERDQSISPQLVDAVLAEWRDVLPEAQLQLCRDSAAVLGAAHQVSNYASILDVIEPTAADRSSGKQILGEFERWVWCLHRAVRAFQCGSPELSEMIS
jgi:aminoglycoside phosphotransferase (APT) family kinase protein